VTNDGTADEVPKKLGCAITSLDAGTSENCACANAGNYRGAHRVSASALLETMAMAYRVYSGPRGAQTVSALEKERLLYKEFDTLDGALSWARHVNESGRTALSVEGDDGTMMSKQDIAAALRHPENAAFGKA
jgi:hypothetical protein